MSRPWLVVIDGQRIFADPTSDWGSPMWPDAAARVVEVVDATACPVDDARVRFGVLLATGLIVGESLFGVVFASGDAQPITVALNNLVNTSTGAKEYNVDMAAAMIAALPTLLVYVVAGKYFVRRLMTSSRNATKARSMSSSVICSGLPPLSATMLQPNEVCSGVFLYSVLSTTLATASCFRMTMIRMPFRSDSSLI